MNDHDPAATSRTGTPPDRTVQPKRLLMCPPTFFDVTYSINPWMDPAKPVDVQLAMAQWESLRSLYLRLGHQVDLISPVAGLPDMVFAANGATVIDGRVLPARFRHPERAPEGPAYQAWFQSQGVEDLQEPDHLNEGEGDFLLEGTRLLAGTGFRTQRRAHDEARRLFGREVVSLSLVDPRFYHLDTALAVLGDGEVMYYPAAFAVPSQQVLRQLYPDAILADEVDAEAFGLNAVSDGLNVVMAETAVGLIEAVRARGFRVTGMDMSELMRAGGSVKCCTLELRGLPTSAVKRRNHL